MVGTKTTDGARRSTDHRARLATQATLAVGTRADVDGVFQRCRYRAVVFRRDEQQSVGRAHLLAESAVGCRRGNIDVFVVERQLADLDDVQFEVGWRQVSQCQRDLTVDRCLAQAAH
ncbi:hypothetical protein FQZ97_1089220 [compost metagenome]